MTVLSAHSVPVKPVSGMVNLEAGNGGLSKERERRIVGGVDYP